MRSKIAILLTGLMLITSVVPVYAAPEKEETTEAVESEIAEEDTVSDDSAETETLSENEAEPMPEEGDEPEIVEAMTTRQSEKSPCQVNITAELPDRFALSCYGSIMNNDTGTIYNFPLYATNNYSQRGFVPEGSYIITDLAVYDDTTMMYPMTVVSNTKQTAGDPYEFTVGKNETADIRITLSNYEEVEKTIQEKVSAVEGGGTGGTVSSDEATEERDIAVATTWEVKHVGSGTGLVGVELDDPDIKQAQECNIIIKITQDGVLGMAKFVYSIDGGVTWGDEHEITLDGRYDLAGAGFHYNFNVSGLDVPGFNAGDTYTCYVPDPATDVVIAHKGSSNVTVRVDPINPEDRAFDILEQTGAVILLSFPKGGTLILNEEQDTTEYPVFMLSLDNGATYSEQQYLTGNTLEIKELGLKLTIENSGTNPNRISIDTDDAWRISAYRETSTRLYIVLAVISTLTLLVVFAYLVRLRRMIPPSSTYRIDEYKPVEIPVKKTRAGKKEKKK